MFALSDSSCKTRSLAVQTVPTRGSNATKLSCFTSCTLVAHAPQGRPSHPLAEAHRCNVPRWGNSVERANFYLSKAAKNVQVEALITWHRALVRLSVGSIARLNEEGAPNPQREDDAIPPGCFFLGKS